MIDKVLDFLPNSDYFFLFYLLFFVVISILIIFLAKEKPKPKSKPSKLEIDNLIAIAKNKNSSTTDLFAALKLYHQNFKVEDDLKKSLELFEAILNHPNRSKELFDFFHGTILPANIKYRHELDTLEKRALNSIS